jgi:alanine-synthesizing transaminase
MTSRGRNAPSSSARRAFGVASASIVFSARTAWDRTQNLLSLRLEVLRGRGVDLVDLTVSHPEVCGLGWDETTLRQLLLRQPLGRYHPHPLGLATTREAVAGELARLGARVPSGQLLLTPSTSAAYSHLFELLCDPGDSVLIPAPSYPLLPYLAELAAVELRPYPLPEDSHLLLDLGLLDSLADESTRAVVVVSPANPTGWRLAPEDHAGLDTLCARRGWALIIDEVFVEFPGPGRQAVSCAAGVDQALTFVLQGLSKSAGLPGWKLAWTAVLGPAPERDEALARLELVADAHLGVNEPVQRALGPLLDSAMIWRQRCAFRLEGNRRTLLAARPVEARWDLLPAGGGWSAVLRLPHTAEETQICLELLEAGVYVQPGHFYDFPRGRFLVLSLLPAPGRFAEGVSRLVTCLQRLLDGTS